jgi:hypothetical protein
MDMENISLIDKLSQQTDSQSLILNDHQVVLTALYKNALYNLQIMNDMSKLIKEQEQRIIKLESQKPLSKFWLW